MENQIKRIKTLESELLLIKEKLKISQSLVKIGFWELNRNTRQFYLSEELLEMINYKSDNQWIDIAMILQFISEEDRAKFADEINSLIMGKEDLDIEFSINITSNAQSHIFRAIANGSKNKTTNPEIVIGIFQDITEQKQTEIYLKNAKIKAEEADILKSAFLANMSHEIRTPLNAILGFSRLLTIPGIPDQQRQEYSEYITSSANNLLNLIRDIVDISKIEAGKMNIEKARCNVNKILRELKITFEKEKLRQSKNQIEINLNEAIEDEDFAILTDPFRFHQILINLIGNALKFTEYGYIEFGYIIINNNQLQFYVKDTGIGIPNDKIDLIFSRFGQIIDNKIKNPGGTGLGLAITKHLVGRLGGKIWLESEIGIGTIFSFTLPFIKVEKQEYKTPVRKEEYDSYEIGKIKVLAVEDDKINMILLEDTLRLNIDNIEIEKAYNGMEAIEKLKHENFDLIIMDIRMPLLNGYETTRKIRQEFDSPKKDVPILGLSAHALKNEIEEGEKIGMNDFLSKPIQTEELFSKIKKLIKKSIPISENINSEMVVDSDNQLINLDFLKKLFKNDSEKLNKTLKVYLNQLPAQLELIEDSFLNQKTEVLNNLSHSLKSTFKYLGRNDLSEFAREIEFSSINAFDYNYISERIDKIKNNWLKIEKAINQRLDQSKSQLSK